MNTSPLSTPFGTSRRYIPSTILWMTAVLLLFCTRTRAAQEDQAAEEKPRNIIAVFRLGGPLTEVPGDDGLLLFSPRSTSLKELVERLTKAANDPEVKALVILSESSWMGPAQVEELRAVMTLARNQGKDVFVHADSLLF